MGRAITTLLVVCAKNSSLYFLLLYTQVTLYSNATKGDGYMDMSKCDLSVDARVGQLQVVALFLFINRLLAFFKELDFSKKAIENAKKSAQEGATAAMSAVSPSY